MTTTTDSADAEAPQPIGLIAPEWALRSSNRGAALWRHAGVMAASAGERVEVFCLDRQGRGRAFDFRDEWNIPAPGARFRVRRVRVGGPMAELGPLERARLEGMALDWVREREPRLAHVLDLEAYGPGLLLALGAIDMPTILTLDRVDELRAALARGGEGVGGASALQAVRRIIVRRSEDIDAAEACGAPRERVRVMAGGQQGETAVLRAYASLYRLIGGSGSDEPSGAGDMTTSAGAPSGGSAA